LTEWHLLCALVAMPRAQDDTPVGPASENEEKLRTAKVPALRDDLAGSFALPAVCDGPSEPSESKSHCTTMLTSDCELFGEPPPLVVLPADAHRRKRWSTSHTVGTSTTVADEENKRRRPELLRKQVRLLRHHFAAIGAYRRENLAATHAERVGTATQGLQSLIKEFIAVIKDVGTGESK
jgi:hypothetical protein